MSLNTWILGVLGGIVAGIIVQAIIHVVYGAQPPKLLTGGSQVGRLPTEAFHSTTTHESRMQEQDVETFIPKPPKERYKIPPYDEWHSKHHPWGADIGLWIGAYITSLLLFGIPLILIIPLHIVLRTAWRNEYFWMIADESLMVGDYVTASQYCCRFSKYGLNKNAARTVILGTADAAQRHGDVHRASQLKKFAGQF